MKCSLRKYTKRTKTHYVGKSGKLYDYHKFKNWGRGKAERGKTDGIIYDDLPKDDYPYTLKYETELEWECCKHCDCKIELPTPNFKEISEEEVKSQRVEAYTLLMP